jgi:probable H4MPT-linked C1 transfer pathway protein
VTAGRVEVVGWDIGGVNVKAARLATSAGGGIAEARVVVRPFEVWSEPGRLPEVLRGAAGEVGAAPSLPMAVTMTAELSDAFRTRGEGVLAVLGAVEEAFPGAALHVLTTGGEFVPPAAVRSRPLVAAATNWVASALYVAEAQPDCILVDVGSTTTDIVPLRGGRIAAEGRSDPERLAAGELVYTGVLRTNPNTIVAEVPLRGRACRVAAEWFTQMADAYLLLGRLGAKDYTCATPDGRPASVEAAAGRLARLVCADTDTLGGAEVRALAAYLAEKQLQQVTEGLLQVLSRLARQGARGAAGRGAAGEGAGGGAPSGPPPLAPAGVGAFLAAEAGRRLGLPVLEERAVARGQAVHALPALAAAALLAGRLAGGAPAGRPGSLR